MTLKGMNLDGFYFTRCKMDWSHLSNAKLSNCTFNDCELNNVSFMNSVLINCSFSHCKFKEAMFINTKLSEVEFNNDIIFNSSFEDARISHSTFAHSKLNGTHFLDASISTSKIKNSDLTDTLFFGNDAGFDIDPESMNKAKLTRATTVTLVRPEDRGVSVPLVGEKIAEVARTIPMRVAMETPTVQREDVDREVEGFLNNLKDDADVKKGQSSLKQDSNGELSIAQQLIKSIAENPELYPNASKIVAKAKNLAEHVDSVVLPGGEDVSPQLYGEKKHPETNWDGDYRRSLMELGLIHHCINKGIPLMAICRAFQMINVYLGARLYQHIGREQVGVQILDEKNQPESDTKTRPAGLYGNVIEGIRAAVYHHQAVPADSEIKHVEASLTRTVTDNGNKDWAIIMAIEQIAGAPIIGLQFHPEFFKSSSSDRAENMILTNEDLSRLAREYVRPGSTEHGLRNPNDMVNSGILAHMSPENNDLWKIPADAATIRRHKIESHKLLASLMKEESTGGKTQSIWKKLANAAKIQGYRSGINGRLIPPFEGGYSGDKAQPSKDDIQDAH